MIGVWELLLIGAVLFTMLLFAAGIVALVLYLTRRQNSRNDQPPAIQQQQR